MQLVLMCTAHDIAGMSSRGEIGVLVFYLRVIYFHLTTSCAMKIFYSYKLSDD